MADKKEETPKHETPKELPQRAQTQQFKGRKKRTPSDQAEFFYGRRVMNIVFFVSSLLLLLSLGAMFYDDYVKDWKNYQRVAQEMELFRVSSGIVREEAKLREQRKVLDALDAKMEEIREAYRKGPRTVPVPQLDPASGVSLKNPDGSVVTKDETHEYGKLEVELEESLGAFQKRTMDFNFKKADQLVVRFHYEESHHKADEAKKEGKAKFPALQKEARHWDGEWKKINDELDAARRDLEEVDNRRKEIENILFAFESQNVQGFDKSIEDLKKEKSGILKEYNGLTRRYEAEKPSLQNKIRNLPMLDFFDPSINIRDYQDILLDIKEELHFAQVTKVDRCRTCHINIGNPSYVVNEAKDEASIPTFKDHDLRDFVDHATGRYPEDGCPICPPTDRFLAHAHPPEDKTDHVDPKDCGICKVKLAPGQRLRAGHYTWTQADIDAANEWQIPYRVGHGQWSEDDEIKFVKSLRAHPRLDLYVTGSSPHGVSKFGCTVCHGGDGRDTEFSRVVHTPTGETQAKDWKRRHGYYIRGHAGELLWDSPMLPRQHVYASCRKCHTDDVELDGGSDYIKGMQLYERVGCYACHRTDTYNVLQKDQENPDIPISRKYRRPGPPLTHIKDKTTKDWMFKWVLNPKHFRLGTRMPRFFGQSNSRDLKKLYNIEVNDVEEARLRNQDEIEQLIARSIVDYVVANGATRVYPDPPTPAKAADVARGKDIFNIQCAACHTDKPESEYARNKDLKNPDDIYRPPEGTSWIMDEFGPNLNGIGGKVNAKWLYWWVKNPKHYFSESRMPDNRLTDQEISDVVAYLMTLRRPEWDAEPGIPAGVDEKLLDHLIFEINTKKMPYRDVKAWYEGKTVDQKLVWLGQKKLMEYGCYSCHVLLPDEKDGINWLNQEGIGTELTGSQPWGNKKTAKMDFGFTHWDHGVNYHGVSFNHPYYTFKKGEPVPYKQYNQDSLSQSHQDAKSVRVGHARWEFLKNKLLDPRVFDGAKLDSKPWDELLKMPNFYLSAEETRLISTFVLSFTNENSLKLLENIRTRPTESHLVTQRGHRVIRENNCKSCHRWSLDRFQLEYTRMETVEGREKEITSWDWIEAELEEIEEDEWEEIILYGIEPDGVDEDNYEKWKEAWKKQYVDAMYKADFVRDPTTLKFHPILEFETYYFIIRKGDTYRYFVKNDDDELVYYTFLRHVPRDGGELVHQITDWKTKQGIDMDPKAKQNPQSRYPPYLRGQGAKTQPKWLYEFLKDPVMIRPNMYALTDFNVRMPKFGFTDEEADSLVRFFHLRDALDGVDSYPHVILPQREEGYLESVKPGIDWARNAKEAFGDFCLTCHVWKGKYPGVDADDQSKAFQVAPELTNVRLRLRPRWIHSWFLSPAHTYPKAIMAKVDTGGRATGLKDILDYLMNADRVEPPAALDK